MLHRTTSTLIRRSADAAQHPLSRSADVGPPSAVDRAALFFRWTAVGLYTALCIASGWVVVRALAG